MLTYGPCLFRAQLAVQIFPETEQDFFTFHPSNPLKCALRLDAAS